MLHVWTLIAMLATAQMSELPKGQFPEGWHVRVDASTPTATASPAPASDIAFVVMKPGWHITTGPAAILYQPTQKAAGVYSVKAVTFLFDPGERREAYGLLLGGRNLDKADQGYSYFLIRRTGEFLIKRRTGATTLVVKDWTSHPAIRTWENRGADERSVRNELEVRVASDTTVFAVNGTEVARVPTRDIDTDGIVGLRVNHHLNLHVSSLDVSR